MRANTCTPCAAIAATESRTAPVYPGAADHWRAQTSLPYFQSGTYASTTPSSRVSTSGVEYPCEFQTTGSVNALGAELRNCRIAYRDSSGLPPTNDRERAADRSMSRHKAESSDTRGTRAGSRRAPCWQYRHRKPHPARFSTYDGLMGGSSA